MTTLLSLLASATLFAFVIGMIRPSLVVWWGNRSRKEVLKAYPLCFLLLVAVASMTTPANKHTDSSNPASMQDQQTAPTPHTNAWHEGGTLHKDNGAAWATATYQNKLATCADFVAATNHQIDAKESKELLDCLDNVFSEPNTHSMNISEAAAACLILMEKTPK
jgi:hypothetical protein